MRLLLAVFVLLFCIAGDAMSAGFGHRRLVSQSGIRPNQVGTHEGVGMSSISHAHAAQTACYWGKRQVASIQYSQRGGLYYAVVRYY